MVARIMFVFGRSTTLYQRVILCNVTWRDGSHEWKECGKKQLRLHS